MVRQWHKEGSEERTQARERQHSQRNGIQGAELGFGAFMVLRKTLRFSSRRQGRCVFTFDASEPANSFPRVRDPDTCKSVS